MIIEHTISGCIAVYNYMYGSVWLNSFYLIVFILLPLIKVLLSIFRTFNKVHNIKVNCSQKIPKKLKKIIKSNNLDEALFLISCEKNFTAVSIGFLSKKIILSRRLISKLSLKELESVVLHELFHTRFHHSSFLFLSEVITNTLFFFPILKDLQIFIKSEQEKSADAYAVSIQKTSKYIKQSLKKVISQENNYGFFPRFSYLVIEQRIDKLNFKKRKISFNLKRIFLSFLTFLLFSFIFLINKNYAMAITMEEKISCNIFNCVRECVSQEIIHGPAMSENNYSVAVP